MVGPLQRTEPTALTLPVLTTTHLWPSWMPSAELNSLATRMADRRIPPTQAPHSRVGIRWPSLSTRGLQPPQVHTCLTLWKGTVPRCSPFYADKAQTGRWGACTSAACLVLVRDSETAHLRLGLSSGVTPPKRVMSTSQIRATTRHMGS